ncbi:MAG: hypothetical protein HY606_04450 [Planctomycetes bacterium]|nr:hypothetical protein [Planctomycetota bacterium]
MKNQSLFGVIVIAVATLVALSEDGKQNQINSEFQEIIIDAPQSFVPDSVSTINISVINSKGMSIFDPVSDASIKILINDSVIYKGKTDDQGNLSADVKIPGLAEGRYRMAVTSSSYLGDIENSVEVSIGNHPRIMIITDKPIYQPSQNVKIKAMLLDSITLTPLTKRNVLLEIEDPKTYKLHKENLETSEFGIVSTDFDLADEVNLGFYKIRCTAGNTMAERQVEVKKYSLPKSSLTIMTDRTCYLPGDTIKGAFEAKYHYGKPLSNCEAVIMGKLAGEKLEFAKVYLNTDEDGKSEFELRLPFTLSSKLQGGIVNFVLEAEITDKADHIEKSSKMLILGSSPLNVYAILDCGAAATGIQNFLYVLTTAVDGSPVKSQLNIKMGKIDVNCDTNEFGMVKFGFVSDNSLLNLQNMQLPVVIQAKSSNFDSITKNLNLDASGLFKPFVIRTDKAFYNPGDSIKLDMFAAYDSGKVTFNIVRKGQILSSKIFNTVKGCNNIELALGKQIFGTVEIHATSEKGSDARVVYVHPNNELDVSIELDKDTYLPADTARIRFTVRDHNGKPVQSAIGVSIVDEAIYSLQNVQSGMERAYFTVDTEILKTRQEIAGSDQINSMVTERLTNSRQELARMFLLNVQPSALPNKWKLDTYSNRKSSIDSKLNNLYSKILQKISYDYDKPKKLDKYTTTQEIDCIDLAGFIKLGDTERGSAYLVTDIISNSDRQVLLATDLHEYLEISSNGSNHYLSAYHGYRWGDHHRYNNLAVNLKTGFNRIVVKVYAYNSINEFKSRFFLKDSDGKDATGLKAKVNGNTYDINGPVVNWMILGPCKDNCSTHFNDVYININGKDVKDGDEAHGLKWKELKGFNGKHSRRILSSMLLVLMIGNDDVDLNEITDPWGNLFSWETIIKKYPSLDQDIHFFSLAITGDYGGGGGRHLKNAGLVEGAEGDLLFQDRRGDVNDTPAHGVVDEVAGAIGAGGGSGSANFPMRIREWFPETLYFDPQLVTDESGVADLDLTTADSITKWRIIASANSKQGGLGSSAKGLVVFQDFFVDIDFPSLLTQSDVVSVPISVFNYLKSDQKVKLVLERENWFDLLDNDVKEINLSANQITAVYFTLKVRKIGTHTLTVKAYGSKLSDAVKRKVEVMPDGQKFEVVLNGKLEQDIEQVLNIPKEAIPDSYKLFFKLYPSVFSQVLDGMEGMFQMPGG